MNVTRGNPQTKTRVSFLLDEGRAKCKAHCSMNKSECAHSDLVEYTLKQVYIVAHSRRIFNPRAHSDEFPSYEKITRT